MVAAVSPGASVKAVDKGWNQIQLNLEKLKGRGVKVGVMGEGKVLEYAMYNEFGTRYAPARPFMGTTADRHRDGVMEYAGKMATGIEDGKYSADQALKLIGEWYQAKIQITIREAKSWAVPNAPETVIMKGSSSPLIDTGRLVQSIRYEVIST
jgi:HK97 gp10 family phage protein